MSPPTEPRICPGAAAAVATFLLAFFFHPFPSHPACRLLAGDVMVSLSRNGHLEIRGGHHRTGDNIEVFTQKVGAGPLTTLFYMVRGKNGTTINGRQTDGFPIARVTGDINIDMGHGANRTLIRNLYTVHNLDIHTGSWHDTVEIRDVCIDNNLTIDTGFGDDNVKITDSVVGSHLKVMTHYGNDMVWIDQLVIGMSIPFYDFSELQHYDTFIVDTGDGRKDALWCRKASVFGSTVLSSGTGENVCVLNRLESVGHLDIEGRAGSDFVYVYDSHVTANARIDLGSRGDFAFMDVLQIAGDFLFNAGGGDDVIFGSHLEASGRVEFQGGGGNRDALKLSDSLLIDRRRLDGHPWIEGFESVLLDW